MSWRKWIVRGVVYGILGAAAIGALLYQRFTNPAAVRELVIAKLGEVFPGAHVSVDSASLRVLGGIRLGEVRLMANADPEKHEFLRVPSAILYHDKEKVLDGELTLRKIELIRPRFRVRRERDGSWNLQGLLRKPDESRRQTHLPAIVIHQGTLILEDRTDPARASSIEINDISLTIVNDPLSTVVVRGAANSDLLGKLQLHGRIMRLDNEAYLSFKATNIPLTQSLVTRFPKFPTQIAAGLQMKATASVHGHLSYHPQQVERFFYDVHCDVNDGSVQHPQLPLALEKLQAKLHCTAGVLQLEKLTAQSGMTKVEATGMGLLAGLDKNFEVDLDLKHVILGEDLANRLPDKIRDLHRMFEPKGPTAIHIACARDDGEWALLSSGKPSTVSLRPEGIRMEFGGFKYPLERAEGNVDYNILDKKVEVRMIAFAGDQWVRLNGHWGGTGNEENDPNVNFEIISKDLPIDEKLIKALPPNLQTFVKSFHATGKVDVTSNIGRKKATDPFRNQYHITVKDAVIRSDHFPYPLTNVQGKLIIWPESWKFNEFRGNHKNGLVKVEGESIPKGDDKDQSFGITMQISGENLPLDEELHDALRPMPGLQKAWETFSPAGNLTFRAFVHRPNAELHDLDITVDARGAAVKPAFFPYRIQDVSGEFRFHHNRLSITKLRAQHDQAMMVVDKATVDLHPRGGYYADFTDVQIQGMRLDDEFVKALPDKLREGVKNLHLIDPFKLKTRVVIAQAPEQGKPPDVFWDAQLWMYKAKFTTGLEFSDVTGTLACVGRHNGRQLAGLHGNLLLDEATLYGQPLKNVHTKFQMRDTAPDVLLMGLRAPLFGGDVTGQIRVNFNSSLDYEMNLTASQINVAEFGRHNLGPKSQFAGVASARLHVKGLSSGLDSLEGNGAIDIPKGHFYNLPFVLDLLKFLGLSVPDRTTFEEFHTDFGIQGPQVTFQKVDLLGSAISLSGKGEYDLQSKKIKLDIYPMWGRIEQLLPPQVRPLPTTISKNLLTVEVRGKFSGERKDVKYQLKPVPIVVDPLLLLRDRMLGQPSGPGTGVPANEPGPIGLAMPAMPKLPAFNPDRPRWFRIWD